MPKLNPRTFSSLVYFEVCGRLLSFSGAAKELHVTTGAISQQIRKLEDFLGIVLFIRHPTGIQLTVEGKELLATTQQSIESINKVMDHLQTKLSSDVIRLKSIPSFVFKWLVPKLKEFNQDFPDIKVETFASGALLDSAVGDFDLAIDYSFGEYQDMDATLLVRETLLPVISPDYMNGLNWDEPAVWKKVSLLHDAMPWVNAPRDAEWRYWLDQTGLNRFASEQGHYFNRSDMAIAAAEAGLGVALAHGSLVTTELANGNLIAPFPSIPSCCNYYLLIPKGSAVSKNTFILRDWLLSKA